MYRRPFQIFAIDFFVERKKINKQIKVYENPIEKKRKARKNIHTHTNDKV